MNEKEGTLRIMPSGRWAVCRPGREPVEITSGERFRVEFLGEMRLTRMEYRHARPTQPGTGLPRHGSGGRDHRRDRRRDHRGHRPVNGILACNGAGDHSRSRTEGAPHWHG
jgi:hypothetical protein